MILNIKFHSSAKFLKSLIILDDFQNLSRTLYFAFLNVMQDNLINFFNVISYTPSTEIYEKLLLVYFLIEHTSERDMLFEKGKNVLRRI